MNDFRHYYSTRYGVQAGILIGTSLIFIIMGALVFMFFANIELHRISLGAIIIAMGMLVDNAIVVNDKAQIRIKMGARRRQALLDVQLFLNGDYLALQFLPFYHFHHCIWLLITLLKL